MKLGWPFELFQFKARGLGIVSPNQPVIRFWMSLKQQDNLDKAAFFSPREMPREEINAEL